MEIEKSLLKVAEHLKAYADQQDQQILDKLKQAGDSITDLADLIKAIPSGDQGPQGDQGPVGEQGPQGEKGQDGKSVSAGEVVFELKANDDFQEYLKSLKGEKGDVGPQGEKGADGLQGAPGEQGPQGEKGADGQSVSALDVATLLASDEEFTKSLVGQQGEQGPAGEKGDKGDKGEDGLSIKAFEIDETTGSLIIEMSDGQVADLGVIKGADGKAGENGKDFDANAFYALFKSDSELISSLKATPEALREELVHLFDDVNKAYTSQINNTLESLQSQVNVKLDTLDDFISSKEATISSIIEDFELVKSETREDAEDATNELVEMSKAAMVDQIAEFDAQIRKAEDKLVDIRDSIERINTSKTITWQPESLTKAGQWVEHEGRYYVCNRDTDSTPGASSAYSMVLRGFEFKKAWNAETTYDKLDVVISATGSAWIANTPAPQGEPGSTPDWNLLVKRGERGAKGDLGAQGPQGEKGDDGISIADVVFDYAKEELQIVKSDGSVNTVEMPLMTLVKELVGNTWVIREKDFELPINDFRGPWHSNISYKRGAIVTYSNAIYIAREDSSNVAPVEPLSPTRQAASNRAWQLFLTLPPIFDASIINNAITSVAALTRDVQALTSGVSHETQVFDVLPAPPATPAEGDAYLVAATAATGAFAGKENNVAFYENGAWVFTPPVRTGETHHVDLQNINLTWNGTKYVKTASGVTSTVSPTAPNGPKDGDFWLDISVQPSNLKSYSATLNGWVNVTNGTRTVTSVNDPAATMGPKNGDIWVKPATTSPVAPAETKSWLNGAWVLGTPTIPISSRTYVQVAAPVGATDGDLWIQHITGQKDVYYHFIAGGWTNDAGTRTFVQDADPAAAAVEGDIWTNITAPVATKVRHNGAWVAPAAAPTIPSGTPVITVGAGVTAARSTRGDQYYDTGNGQFYVYDGTNWVQPGPKFLQITQAAYTALATKDSNTLYIIVG